MLSDQHSGLFVIMKHGKETDHENKATENTVYRQQPYLLQ